VADEVGSWGIAALAPFGYIKEIFQNLKIKDKKFSRLSERWCKF